MKPPRGLDEARTVGEGRYVPVQVLGEGGQCQVLAAWDTRLRLGRAIKVMLPEAAAKTKLRARFVQEAETQRRLAHPHIVRVHDVFPDAELPWMVMDLIEGGSLDDWVGRHGPMPHQLAIQVILDAAKGLEAAHAEGTVHRDVKPANVLIHASGLCKVADFGIARALDSGLTRTGAVFGTLGFIAPEQLEDASSVDARADVYSLAATLFSLIAMPSHSEQLRLADDRELLHRLPTELQGPLYDALRSDPAERTPSMAALAAALQHALELLPADPPHPPLVEPLTLDGPLDTAVIRELFDSVSSHAASPPTPPPIELQPRRAPSDDDVPDYVVEQEVRDDRLPSPPPPPPRPAPPPPRRSLGPVIAALLLMGLLLLGGAAATVTGSSRLHEAHATSQAATEELHTTLDADATVVDELEALGFDVSEAREALDAWQADPSLPQARRAVHTLAESAQPLLASVPTRPDAVQARQRLDRLLAAREAERRAAAAWAAQAGSPLSWPAAALGLAPTP